MHDGNYEKVSREKLAAELTNSGILEDTRERAYGYARQAKKNLEVLPESRYRSALEEIPTYMIERNS